MFPWKSQQQTRIAYTCGFLWVWPLLVTFVVMQVYPSPKYIQQSSSYFWHLNVDMLHLVQPGHTFIQRCVFWSGNPSVGGKDAALCLHSPPSLSIFRFFEDLERRHYDNPVIRDISDIVQNHAAHHFEPYIVYCSNETFQQRTLQKLLWVAAVKCKKFLQ